jgi:sensor histidine kinase YesM
MLKFDRLMAKDAKMIDLIVEKRYRVLRHIALYALFLAIIFFSDWLKGYSGPDKYYRLICVFSVFIVLFYINMYVLVPVLFFRGRYVIYLLLLVVLVKAGLALTSLLIDNVLAHGRMGGAHLAANGYKSLYEGTLIAVLLIFTTTTIKLFQRWKMDNERISELRNLTLTMELNELRNQINPHFLFNMLNGIKSLVRTDPEMATTVIMKLSDLLRYQLYENNAEKTSLRSEVNFLSDFLNLEKLRRDNLSVEVSCKLEPQALKTIFIPPNLFTTFVENAVKHSVNMAGDDSCIIVVIDVQDGELLFTCANSKDSNYIPSTKNGGLGLTNIKKRLSLLYEGRHKLEIESNERQYVVNLTIPV